MADQDEGRAALRRITARMDVDELLARMEAGFRELPAYRRFVGAGTSVGALDDRGRVVIRWNIELFLRWLADGRPPSEADLERLHELVRVRAAEGMPMEEGLLVYRRGARVGWDALLEAARDDERLALLEGTGVFFNYVEMVSDVFARAYADEPVAASSAAERRARALLDRFCAQGPLAPEDHERAASLGVALPGVPVPFALQVAGAGAREHAALAVALRAGGVLAATEGRRVCGVAAEAPAWAAVGAGLALVVVADPPTARGGVAVALEELRALLGFAVAAGARGAVDAGAFLPELLLAQAPRVAQRLHARVLGMLEDGDHPELVATVRALARHGFDRTAAAGALPVHRNTLRYRVARIEALTGLDFDDPRHRGLVWLAAQDGDAAAR
jgi:hypothetical protein